jgi:hypothetical protein
MRSRLSRPVGQFRSCQKTRRGVRPADVGAPAPFRKTAPHLSPTHARPHPIWVRFSTSLAAKQKSRKIEQSVTARPPAFPSALI